MADGLDARNGSILIVCTGNVCRSPYIERSLMGALAETNIRVSSAGTGAMVGSDMDPRVSRRLLELGFSSGDFAARQLTAEMARSADLILTASRAHRSWIVRTEPSVLRRTHALADFSDLAAHLKEAGIDQGLREEASGNFVRNVSDAAVRLRSEIRARSREEAEILDPYRASDKVMARMIEQVDGLLPSVAWLLSRATFYRI